MKSLISEGKGLSLSKATSISNILNQRAVEIVSILDSVNNYSKVIKIDGHKHFLQKPVPMPVNVKELIDELGILYATQAFLMENIKEKDNILKDIKSRAYSTTLPIIPVPSQEPYREVQPVDEQWGWNQLTVAETNEFIEAEAKASHIGQFIHKRSKLDNLRKELPTIPSVEFYELKKDEKTPVIVDVHHTSEQLLELHNYFATKHRDYEMKVNYFKSKVKNLVSDKNAEIAKQNAIDKEQLIKRNNVLLEEYKKLSTERNDKISVDLSNFEEKRELDMKAASKLKINVDQRFQSTIDKYITTE